jgi:chromosome segregation ATPase
MDWLIKLLGGIPLSDNLKDLKLLSDRAGTSLKEVTDRFDAEVADHSAARATFASSLQDIEKQMSVLHVELATALEDKGQALLAVASKREELEAAETLIKKLNENVSFIASARDLAAKARDAAQASLKVETQQFSILKGQLENVLVERDQLVEQAEKSVARVLELEALVNQSNAQLIEAREGLAQMCAEVLVAKKATEGIKVTEGLAVDQAHPPKRSHAKKKS